MRLNQSAYSLLELLIVLAIIAILASTSFPLFSNFRRSSQDEILLSQLQHAIQLARSEAVIRNQTVTVCHSDNNMHCVGTWQQGQIIFVDSKQDGMLQDTKQIITVQQSNVGQGKLFWRSFPNHIDYLQFTRQGTTQTENGSFWYCSTTASNPCWAILVSKSGRRRVVKPDKFGEILDEKGERLHCVN